MGSYNYGKDEIVKWVKENFNFGATCLDVGACDGKWAKLLGDYLDMDGVEIFTPNIIKHDLAHKYKKIFDSDIANLEYEYYDLIIFGDVIEHMSVEKAQKVLNYAKNRCADMIIGVPFLYSQGPIYGNPYEVHIQNDLTEELFKQRYPGYTMLLKAANDYAYYTKERP